MDNIESYEIFRLNESNHRWWDNQRLPRRFRDRIKTYDLPENPTLLQRTHRFLRKMEDRIERMSSIGQMQMQQKRSERGGGPNTGVELLFGLPAVVPYVLRRIFSPTQLDFGSKKAKSDEDLVKPEFARHTNELFIKNDLKKLRNEGDLENYVENLYKKAGVKPRQSPSLDELVRNRTYIWNLHQMDPNNRIFQS
jgi:hypothetical protein